MSSLHDRIRGRLAVVRRDLDEVIGRLEAVPMDWAPSPGMRTIGGQLLEIAATEEQMFIWMTEGREESYKAMHARLERLSREEYVAVLNEIRARTLSYLDSLSVEELQTQIEMPKGWFESLDQDEVPRSEVFRSMSQHEWYHTGQLVSYLWMRGDDPYEW